MLMIGTEEGVTELTKWEVGVGLNKPVKDFTAAERGCEEQVPQEEEVLELCPQRTD